MNKEKIVKLLYFVLIVLVIGFGICVLVDYLRYDTILNSAPFYIFIITRFVEFIVPSIIIFIVATLIKANRR
ncbi:hypothetical protein [Floccifex sp.]|uniref:hypothetical protein n=1 Tax=Floccifex sp. TaxID=2815810 RepID=UPI003F0447E3